MKADRRAYERGGWRALDLTRDFRLEDEFDLRARPPKDVSEFMVCFWDCFRALSDGVLAETRLRVGRALGWDDHDFTLPIAGCDETSVDRRLTDDDRKENLAAAEAPSPVPSPIVKTVYVFRDEALYEFSNDTIHGLLHVCVHDGKATLAVYVKHRGVASRLYMASIWPARHALIYPSMIRKVERAWRDERKSA
jgi:hypothetical protein